MNAHPTWIDHFPENFTWSNAMLVTKGMAPYGACGRQARDTGGREKLCDAAGSESKTVKLFTPEEGGAEHCHVDNRAVGVDYVDDWVSETFQR